MARLCAAGVTLRNQINKEWPKRDKSSDGWIGDAAHQAKSGWGTNGRGSYHNQDPNGVVHAIDVDENFGPNPKSGKAAREFAEQLATYCREGKDGGRIAHIVYEDQVASGTAGNWHFRGSGYSHFQHIHISFTNKADNDGSKFKLPIFEDVSLWDGRVPKYENIISAMEDKDLKNLAAWRLSCRLADMGFFKGTPVKYEQGYPWKSVGNWQKQKGYNVVPLGTYGPKAHKKIFGLNNV